MKIGFRGVPWTLLGLSCLGMISRAAFGVVVDHGNEANIVAPADNPGFDNVGIRGIASAVYLGNRWVLTASHVGAGSTTFRGTTYEVDPNTPITRLGNVGNLTPLTDMILYRLDRDPGLKALRLPCGDIDVGNEVMLVGRGRDAEPTLRFWNVNEGPGNDDDEWVEVNSDPSTRQGYLTQSTKTVRWGKNIVNLPNTNVDTGFGDVVSFQTSFDAQFGVPNEAQGVVGDSGGASFRKNGLIWELAGMVHAVDVYENQPGGAESAVFGNETYMSNLYLYRDQLRAIADFEPDMGDFDGDGAFTGADIDLLFLDLTKSSSAISESACHFDVTGDGNVTKSDTESWIGGLAKTVHGDADLDGKVNFSDFLKVSAAFESQGGWNSGDFTGDGKVMFDDFLALSSNFGFEVTIANQAGLPANTAIGGDVLDAIRGGARGRTAESVPEPGSWILLAVGVLGMLTVCRGRCLFTARRIESPVARKNPTRS